ncbi:MAG TPA: MFS transporter [Gemmatimonadales bacterium]
MTEARGWGFGALRHKNFRLFFFGQAVSLTGTWMQTVAQGWLVLLLTDSPFYVGLVSALGSLGVLLFSLYAGVVADRTDKRRAILITQTLQMLQALALAILVWTDTVTVGSVMALAAFLGVVSAFDIPIRQSFVIDMVGKDDLLNAIALNSSVFNATRVLGPAVAGVVIGKLGIVWCFVLNAFSYLAVLRNLAAMELPPPPSVAPTGSAWAGFREIVAFVRGDARVTALIVLTGVLSVFGFPFLIMMPVFARDVLKVGAEGYGVLMASVGLGAMVGALGIAAYSRWLPRGRLQLAGGTAFGLLVALFAVSRSFALAVLLLGLAGCAMIVNNALTNTMLQTLVPDHLRGRVMGFYSLVFVGMGPLGAFQAGVFAERFGAPMAVGFGGVACALAVALTWWRVPELREA